MAQEDIVDTPSLLSFFFTGAVLTLAIIVGAQTLYLWGADKTEQERNVHIAYREVDALMEAQDERLEAYSIADKEQKRVAVPIAVGKELLLKDMRKD